MSLKHLHRDARDELRRAEARYRPELRRTRYLQLKRPERLTDRQQAGLAWLRGRDRALATARAYRWRLGFDEFFCQPAHLAEAYLERPQLGEVPPVEVPQEVLARVEGRGSMRLHRDLVTGSHEVEEQRSHIEATDAEDA